MSLTIPVVLCLIAPGNSIPFSGLILLGEIFLMHQLTCPCVSHCFMASNMCINPHAPNSPHCLIIPSYFFTTFGFAIVWPFT